MIRYNLSSFILILRLLRTTQCIGFLAYQHFLLKGFKWAKIFKRTSSLSTIWILNLIAIFIISNLITVGPIKYFEKLSIVNLKLLQHLTLNFFEFFVCSLVEYLVVYLVLLLKVLHYLSISHHFYILSLVYIIQQLEKHLKWIFLLGFIAVLAVLPSRLKDLWNLLQNWFKKVGILINTQILVQLNLEFLVSQSQQILL